MPAHRTRLALVAAVALIGGVATFLLVQPAAQAATAAFVRTSSWAGGYEAKFTITNTTSSTIDSWTVEFDFPAGTSVGTFWDALVTTSGRHVTATNRNYNGTLAPGATTTFGFVAAGTGDPTNCTVNGAPCGVGLDDGDGGEDRNADNDDREDGDADNEDGDADNGDSDADNDGGDGDADGEDGGDGEGDGEGDDELVSDIREHVAKRIGKLARPKRIIWADDLPKTRSGKIMRRLLRDIAEGRELGDVTTLRDPDVMAQLEGKVKERQAEEE
jgi:hypothetical protein